ncbi:MAG TPA: type II secretion system protein [Candidatus Babeliales bacterium]|jgi:prepilin-type N-terminal cleavage/methylation domain-containing protein|nr:type II secretion system protein [Candidatus Babeliales bacterium]
MIYIKSGFTLIEAMVVIALFAIVATLGMMQLSFLDDTITHAEVDKLATACSYLQQKAIASNSDQMLVCDTEKSSYRGDNVTENLSSRVCFGFLPNVLGSPGSPSRTITKAITFADSSIHFYPTGTLSSGTVYLTDKHKKNMYALSNAVSQVSYLRLYRYDGKWKLLGQE